MENFTFREIHVDENRWENRSVSLFFRLLLWRFAKISQYDFCTAHNIY